MDESSFTVGGALWINLCNTIANHNKKRADLLDNPEAAKRWLEVNELVLAQDRSKLDESDTWEQVSSRLHELRILSRTAISDLKKRESLSKTLLSSLDKILRDVMVHPNLVNKKEKWEIDFAGTNPIDHVTYHIIQSLLETVQTISPDRIRECEHENCILSFIDTSKSGRRRWCRMSTCGNRTKAAEFYARKKQNKG
ncbi:CGNR zinc finger domain-containing protein [Shimazuella kribbensis]|uniref:CGNR zinc finger domain-containing protein n=1 Tax=Shimazuella kribbensis TaxID=139808 RepID=UPI0004178E0E|nr:CGNR zinc finger domain-containing protein [Shimazuella kribbensis]